MANPPNILFLFPDQHRFDWIGGDPDLPALSTPHLDALARRGTRFTRGATVASPLCAPSRACLAAGSAARDGLCRYVEHDF